MRSPRPQRMLLAGAMVVFFGIACLTFIRLMVFAFSPQDPKNRSPYYIEIHRGQSPQETTQLLTHQKIISHPRLFIWLGRLTGQWKKVKAGEYEVSPSVNPLEILSIFTSGVSVAHPITVREGENMYEVAADIEAKGLGSKSVFLARCKDPSFISTLSGFEPPLPNTLEGYLFPDTYFFNKTMNIDEMIRQMVRHFLALWGEKENVRARELNLTRHQIVTLASIVEKETGAAQERPLISSVFYNRLKKKMRLQSDPTIIYGIWDRYRGNLHKEDITSQTLFNTYVIPALPIGPIANPGREAIQAALYPSESEFLYFVSKNDGTHFFSRTLAEHSAAVRDFQLNPRAREGKSWRDLKKDHAKHPSSGAQPSQ